MGLRKFTQNLREGIAGERAMNFGGTPLNRQSQRKAHAANKQQTNIKQSRARLGELM
jgi:hypothetical protein